MQLWELNHAGSLHHLSPSLLHKLHAGACSMGGAVGSRRAELAAYPSRIAGTENLAPRQMGESRLDAALEPGKKW